MGSSSMLYVLGTMSLFALMSFNLNRALLNQSENAYEYFNDVQCRNACNSVVSMILSKVSDEANFRTQTPVTISVFGGTSSYRVVDSVSTDTSVKITVTTTYGRASKTITVIAKKPTVSIPQAFSYTAVSNGNFSLSGGATIQASDPSKNVLLHSNGNFSLNGSPTKVYGFVTHSGSFSGNSGNVIPASNPNSLPSVSSTGAYSIPSVNPDANLSSATSVYMGDLSIGGNYAAGAPGSPAIIYIGGNLSISSGARLSGYAIFLVKGNISVNGGAQFINPNPSKSNFAFYTSGNVSVTGNATIYGQIVANGNVNISGNSSFAGTVVANGSISISGGSTVDVPVSEDLISPIWGNLGSNSNRLATLKYYE